MSAMQRSPCCCRERGRRSLSPESREGLWSDVWKRFKHNPIALAGFYVVCVLLFIALFADFLANDKPYYLALSRQNLFSDFSQLSSRR